MKPFVYVDLLSKADMQALLNRAQGPSAVDATFVYSHHRKQHPIKGVMQQQLLSNRLQELWLDHLHAKLPGQSLPLCEKKFSWLLAHAKEHALGSADAPITSVKQALRVMEEIDGYSVVAGKGITPFEFLRPDAKDGVQGINLIVSTVLRYCFADPQISTLDMAKMLPLKDILLKQNPEIEAQAVSACSAVFNKLTLQLQGDPSFDPQLASIAIKNMLALITFFSPQDAEVITVPTYLQGQWEGVDYKIERLRISGPDYPFSPYYGYGLLPVDVKQKAPPLLLFMGTTYPSSSGFFTYMSDLHPFKSVGKWAFEQGQAVIEDFVKRAHARTGERLHLIGQSLGGSLSLLTAMHFHEHIENVDAFSSPALVTSDVTAWNHMVDAKSALPKINIYCQQYDPVPMVGQAWGKDWNIRYVHGFPIHNGLEGHIRVGSAARSVVIVSAHEKITSSFHRTILGIIHRLAGLILFPLAQSLVFFKRWIILLTQIFHTSRPSPS